jgi:hypothetical protein
MQCACGVVISDRDVLAEAGRIRVKLRKRRGGPPRRTYTCARCGEMVSGRVMLDAHVRMCPSPPPQPLDGLEPVTDADMEGMRWTPDAE